MQLIRSSIFLIIILTLPSIAHAQFVGTDPVFTASIYGNTANIVFTSDSPNQVAEYDPKLGFGVKFGYTETIQEDLKASLDIGLLRGGWTADDPNSSEKFEFDVLYLTIEPSIQKSFNSILARAGVFYDIGLAGTNKLPSGSEFKIFKDEALNRGNAGISFGTGIDISDATKGFISNLWDVDETYFFEFNLDYRLGLIDVEGSSDSNNQKARLSYLTFGIKTNF